MALTLTQQVRLRIQDRLRLDEEIQLGNGTASGFKLKQGSPFSTVTAATAYVVTTAGWSATGSTIDLDLGRVTLSGIVSANSAVRFEYQWSVFSTDEVGQFTAVGGSVAGAALEAVKTLMFDSLKRARWSSPDGSSYDDTAANSQLKTMYDMLFDEIREGGIDSGGIESWSEEQGNYSGDYNV